MKSQVAIFIMLLISGMIATAEPVFREIETQPSPRLPAGITEASGAAVSVANNDFLWVVNDSGGSNQIHLIQTDGTSRGSVRVKGAINCDWEDLASVSMNDESYLVIADTGDNSGKREFCTLYFVREPALPKQGEMLNQVVPLAWKIDFSWQGGPRDCEAVGIDANRKKILLVTKRTSPPEVHELPLGRYDQKLVTRKIGEVRVKAPGFSFIKIRNQPTAMDISADGKRAVIATYHGLFVFDREKGKAWHDVFADKSPKPRAHELPQAEAVALSRADGRSITTLSEGKSSRMLLLEEVN